MRLSDCGTTPWVEGKVVLAEFFWDHQEALETAGLSD
jgi:hypothetical protein